MFPGWARRFHGRRPVNPALSLRRKAATVSGLCMAQAQELFGNLLPVSLFSSVAGFRQRLFPLPVVFWTFLCQILAGASCRAGVASVQVLQSRIGRALCSTNTAAYCKARVRIPIRLLLLFHRDLIDHLAPRRRPRTWVFDGTTLGMAQREFTIQNKLGIHARPAAQFVKTASRFSSEVRVEKDGEEVDGKSIMASC